MASPARAIPAGVVAPQLHARSMCHATEVKRLHYQRVTNAEGRSPALVCTQYPPLRAGGTVVQFELLHGIEVPLTVRTRGLTMFPQLPPWTRDKVSMHTLPVPRLFSDREPFRATFVGSAHRPEHGVGGALGAAAPQ